MDIGTDQLTIHELIEDVMSTEGLTLASVARDLDITVASLHRSIQNLGVRRSQIAKMRKLSLSLNKPGNWLLRELRKRGLR